MAWVATEVWVRSLAQGSGLKDPALPQLQLRFNAWPRNFNMPWVWPLKKKIPSFLRLNTIPLYYRPHFVYSFFCCYLLFASVSESNGIKKHNSWITHTCEKQKAHFSLFGTCLVHTQKSKFPTLTHKYVFHQLEVNAKGITVDNHLFVPWGAWD